MKEGRASCKAYVRSRTTPALDTNPTARSGNFTHDLCIVSEYYTRTLLLIPASVVFESAKNLAARIVGSLEPLERA